MKPFSALYYIKQNKGRSITAAIMFLLSVLMLMGGNYIASNIWAFEESGERLDRFVTLGYLSTDTDAKDWDSVLEDVAADDRLQLIRGSGYGQRNVRIHHRTGKDVLSEGGTGRVRGRHEGEPHQRRALHHRAQFKRFIEAINSSLPKGTAEASPTPISIRARLRMSAWISSTEAYAFLPILK